MKKTFVVVALAAALMAGCASHDHHLRIGDRLHSTPLLTVRLGIVSVAPEPIVLDLSDPKAMIAWQAPAGFTFPANGIEILGLVVDSKGNPIAPDPKELKAPNLGVQGGGSSEAFRCKSAEKEFTCAPVAGVVRRGGRLSLCDTAARQGQEARRGRSVHHPDVVRASRRERRRQG